MICLCLTKRTLHENTQLIKKYTKYIHILELRVDKLTQQEQTWKKIQAWVTDINTQFSIDVICTIRLTVDYGNWEGRHEERISLFKSAVQSGLFTFVDIEEHIEKFSESHTSIEDILSLCHKNTTILLSNHIIDESSTHISSDWKDSLLALSKKYPQCIVKSAISCNNSAMLCEFIEHSQALKKEIYQKYIVAPMGIYGLPARILSKLTGSILTFTSDTTADGLQNLGHIDPRTLVELYQYNNITSHTQVFGIIGDPIMHSQSPKIHNHYFKEANMQDRSHKPNKIYIHIPLDDCAYMRRLASLINLKGFSITIPHKKNILAYVDEMYGEVNMCKSCNTVIIDDNNKWHAYNTDIPGFLAPLYRTLGIVAGDDDSTHADKLLSDYKICVIGAGGSARAICYALLVRGANIIIANRTEEKAQQLAEELTEELAPIIPSLQISSSSLTDYHRISEYSDIIVQASSVGMNSDEVSPFPDYPFKGTEVVYDIVYTQTNTKIMRDAKKRNCTIISGKEMFNEQGLLQSKLFKER